ADVDLAELEDRRGGQGREGRVGRARGGGRVLAGDGKEDEAGAEDSERPRPAVAWHGWFLAYWERGPMCGGAVKPISSGRAGRGPRAQLTRRVFRFMKSMRMNWPNVMVLVK